MALHTGGPLGGGTGSVTTNITTTPPLATAVVTSAAAPSPMAPGGLIKYPGGGTLAMAGGGVYPGELINYEGTTQLLPSYQEGVGVTPPQVQMINSQGFVTPPTSHHNRIVQNASDLMNSSNYYAPQPCWALPPSVAASLPTSSSASNTMVSIRSFVESGLSTTPMVVTTAPRCRRPMETASFYATPAFQPQPPVFATSQSPVYHNPAVAASTICISAPEVSSYMHPHPSGLHDPNGAFAMVNGNATSPSQQRIFLPGNAHHRLPAGALRVTHPATMGAYFPASAPTTIADGTSTMFLSGVPPEMVGGGDANMESPPRLPSTGLSRKTDSGGATPTTKKKRTKITKNQSRAAANKNRGGGVPNPTPKMMGLGHPIGGPLLPTKATMFGAMMMPPSVSTTPPASVWGALPPRIGPPGLLDNGMIVPVGALGPTPNSGMVVSHNTQPLPPPPSSQLHHQQHPSRLALHPAPPQLPVSCTAVYVPTSTSVPISTTPSTHQQQTAILPPNPHDPLTERLVCPITNGTVVHPMVLQMDSRNGTPYSDDPPSSTPSTLIGGAGFTVRSCDFDLSKNHLATIVERSDLDIVVCAHLSPEPLQMCHWPEEAAFIRFNGTQLALDRTVTADGQPAHKVCGVKNFCQPGKNTLEIFLCPVAQPSRNETLASNAAALRDHRFAVFMAHMPTLSMVLDGLQRRLTDEAVPMMTLLISSWRNRPQQQLQMSINDNDDTPVVATISLVCPVFRTRMQIPGRIAGCQHIEAFDMEAFLHREVLWPRLLCPICRNGSNGGLENLYIDLILANIIQLAPKSALSVQVRSDGYWRLSPPMSWQLPQGADQWQSMMGPSTQAFAIALKSPPVSCRSSNGVDVGCGPQPSKRTCGTMSSPSIDERTVASQQGHKFANPVPRNSPSVTAGTIPENPPLPRAQWSQSLTGVDDGSPEPSPSLTGHRKRGHSSCSTTSSIISPSVASSPVIQNSSTTCQPHLAAPPSSEPDLCSSATVDTAPSIYTKPKTVTPPPRSLPPPTIAKTFVKPSPPQPPSVTGSHMVPSPGSNNLFEARWQSQPFRKTHLRLGEPSEDEVRWAFEGIGSLEMFADIDYRQFVNSL